MTLFNVLPIEERFQDPLYPVMITLKDRTGEVTYEHDRQLGKLIFSDNDSSFNEILIHLKQNRPDLINTLRNEIQLAIWS